jgi:hypothetical protein
VPLSDHEQRLLDQIERALYAEDPKFASTVRSADVASPSRRRLAIGVLAFIVGVGLLVAGVALPFTPAGVLGFLVMLGSVLVVLTSLSRRPSTAVPNDPSGLASAPPAPSASRHRATGPARRKSSSSGGVVGRLEERWRRRWDERER